MSGGGRLYNRKTLRKFVEFAVDLKVLPSGVPELDQDAKGFVFEGKNFSVGGIGVETNMPIKPWTHVHVSFVLPGERRRLSLDGTVQSVTDFESPLAGKKMFIAGIKFHNVSPTDYTYMNNYMAGTFLLF